MNAPNTTEHAVPAPEQVRVAVARGRWPRAATVVTAAALVLAALFAPPFRTEGHLSGLACLPLAAAAAVVVIGFALGTTWLRAARWFALSILGQAVALQYVNAGNLVGHQHYPTLSYDSIAAHGAELAFFLLQAVIVVAALRSRLTNWPGVVQRLGAVRVALASGAFILTSTALSRSVGVYAGELLVASLLQALNLATVALAVASLPPAALARLREFFRRLLGDARDMAEPGGVDRFALLASLWVLVACAALAWFSYQRHPHVPDEIVYVMHGRYFARGLLALPLPPVPAAFDLDLMTFEATRWYSPVPPGWPAALAVGAFFGADWLVNPVLNALNVLLAYLLVREFYDRRTARLALLLLCASPWFVFMGINFMTHTFTLTCALAAAVAVARMRRGPWLWWVPVAAVPIGILGMIRPLEGLTVAMLIGFWALGPWPWTGTALARVSALALASIAVSAITLPYNNALAGDPLTFPLMAYTDSIYGVGVNALGFGANRGIGWPGLDPFPGHGAIDVLVNANLNLHSINIELLGWSIGSWLPIIVLLTWGKLSRADWHMVTALAAIVGVHSFYWFSGGPDFGARYWYLVIFPCIALTARAALVAVDGFSGAEPAQREANRVRVLAGVLALCVSAVICFVPWRAIDKYYHYRNMRPDMRRLAREHDFGRSIVLIRGRRHPDYASAAFYNPLDLKAAVPIYIWDRDPNVTRAALLEYSDRDAWIVDGPTVTGGGYRIVQGPVPVRELIARYPPP